MTARNGASWLDGLRVPNSWTTTTLGRAGTLVGGSAFPHDAQGSTDGEVPFFKVSDLGLSHDSRTMGAGQHRVAMATARQLRATVVPPDAVVWAKIGAALLLNRRRVTREPACIDNNMTAFVPDSRLVTTAWALYWTSSLDFGAFANPGAVPSFSEGSQAQVPILLPPLEVQRRITAFLDFETARIDQLVQDQEHLLALVSEKREALIASTVQNGIDDSATMASTGLDWWRYSPSHWLVVPLRSLARSGTKTFTDGDWVETPHITDSGIRLLQTGNIGVGQFIEQGGRYVSETSFKQLRCTEVMPGDVLICRLAAPVGRACLAPDLGVRMITSVDVSILKTSPAVSPQFITYLLSSRPYLDAMAGSMRGGTRDRVSRSFLGAFRIAMPPRAEQNQIAAFLDGATAQLDRVSEATQQSLGLLRERRSALITAAVTGQIDVSSWTPPDDWLTPEAA